MEKPFKTSADSAKGFTFIEIIISTVLVTLGIMAIAQVLSSGMSAGTDVENVHTALNIAQTKMEQLRNTAFASVVSSSATADSTFPNFTTTVTVTGADPKQIDVTVQWNVQGGTGTTSVSLTTLRTNV